MKGIFNLRPALPRKFAVWDPDSVLDYLSNFPHKKISEILPLHSGIIVVLSNK